MLGGAAVESPLGENTGTVDGDGDKLYPETQGSVTSQFKRIFEKYTSDNNIYSCKLGKSSLSSA